MPNSFVTFPFVFVEIPYLFLWTFECIRMSERFKFQLNFDLLLNGLPCLVSTHNISGRINRYFFHLLNRYNRTLSVLYITDQGSKKKVTYILIIIKKKSCHALKKTIVMPKLFLGTCWKKYLPLKLVIYRMTRCLILGNIFKFLDYQRGTVQKKKKTRQSTD